MTAWSPDGSTVLFGGLDGTVREWDPDTGRQLGTGLDIGHEVWDVGYSRSDHEILTAEHTGLIRRWDVAPDAWYDRVCRSEEVWQAELRSSTDDVLATTAPTLDVPDGEEGTWAGTLGQVTLASAAARVIISHGRTAGRSPNSVHPVCLEATALDDPTEPSLTQLLTALDYTDLTELSTQRFSPGSYDVRLVAEFTSGHPTNSLDRYAVGTDDFNELFAGPIGKLGVVPVGAGTIESFTSDASFGLSVRTADGGRHLTESGAKPRLS